ncbi:MAG TPA: response regulator [Paenibacillus sp.]|uniref:response regulator transcription factor n=1 Tax=Paenibacillus sp. TaxID=58172 RepID=UPI002BDBA683|nr:response regulator [Paenibacillus sp.]HUC90599.1 response regulator [Paenibacillus sp.]
MNIFLVEDEHWALAELVELFKIYAPEHNVYPFENGEDALAAAGKLRPQLVLTDVNMPGIDGLELIAGLNGLDPAVTCIILSVHDEFAYVQQGMKIGAIDYLLKPVKKDALYKTVDKAIADIRSDARQQEERADWSVTQLLLASDAADDEASASICHGRYAMAVLLLGNWSPVRSWRDTAVTNGDLKKQLADSGCADEEDIHCVSLDSHRKAILIRLHDDGRMEGVRNALAAMYEHLNRLGLTVHLAYALKKEKEHAHQCFTLLKKRIEEQMKLGTSTWIVPESKTADIDLIGTWDRVRVLQTLLKQGDLLKGRETVHRIVHELRKKDVTARQLKLFVSDLFYSLKYNLQAVFRTDINLNNLQEDLRFLTEISGYEELADWLTGKLFGLFTDSGQKDMKLKGLIPVMMNRIHANYQRELSLQQFAADNHVSPGYLSRLFKSQTGCTFSDYIIRYRIGKAKELLAAGVERLSDVSGMVGYEDVKHFSHLFKKIVGEPPNAYAKRVQANR